MVVFHFSLPLFEKVLFYGLFKSCVDMIDILEIMAEETLFILVKTIVNQGGQGFHSSVFIITRKF